MTANETKKPGVATSSQETANTKISCEGRHRECPDLVCCILLLAGVQIKADLFRRAVVRCPIALDDPGPP